MRARAKSYEDLRESRLLDVLAMSDSVRKAARSALCLLLLLHAPGVNGQQKIYFGVNALCTSDSNCTVAGQKYVRTKAGQESTAFATVPLPTEIYPSAMLVASATIKQPFVRAAMDGRDRTAPLNVQEERRLRARGKGTACSLE
eukprot:753713-Hanusia_phi.AAC.2